MDHSPYTVGNDVDMFNNGHMLYTLPVVDQPQPMFLGHIDPVLHQFSNPSVERYLNEGNHRPLLGSAPNGAAFPFQPIVHHQLRDSSPSSQQQSFATSDPQSGPQSPRTESDNPNDSTGGPPTPPPEAESSYPTKVLDTMESQLALAGLGFASHDGYVRPSEIQPGLADVVPFPVASEPTSPYPRYSSLESEIHVRSSPAPIYPDPEQIDEPINQIGHRVMRHPAIRDEDEEYKPSGSRQRSARAPKTNRRGRPPKRGAAIAPVDQYKVTKATPVTHLGHGRRLPSTSSASLHLACPECPDGSFKDNASLQKHIKTQHKRPFTCVFNFAGCNDAFANKNEWKRHVAAQHLNLHFWLCMHGGCGQTINNDCEVLGSPTHGRPFRRKDLYTQHVRRMHLSSSNPETGKHRKNSTPELEAQVKSMQDAAFQKRCEMPKYMQCPAYGCTQDFHGEKAWDDRMEHVARHLERASNNAEPPVEFGGAHDTTLTNWASSDGVRVIRQTSRGWEQCQPLKNTKMDLHKVPGRMSGVDEDAEGEECS